MNYHNITHDDMKNGDGLRVVLWVAGCGHHCKNCQNPQTWDPNSGILFDDSAEKELFTELGKEYISGITFSGGDPCYPGNIDTVVRLMKKAKAIFPKKDIWVYTGYELPHLTTNVMGWSRETHDAFLKNADVIVDGPYIDKLRDTSLHWIGSSNQHVWRRNGINYVKYE